MIACTEYTETDVACYVIIVKTVQSSFHLGPYLF